jgi:nitrate reductase / nitrite oxidoreductase, alpha subunit
MAMGHVILKEFFVDRQVPFFTDYVKTYTDLPFLITLTENAQHGGPVPGKFLTELDLETRSGLVEARSSTGPERKSPPEAAWKTVLLDAGSGKPVIPNGSMGFRYANSGAGRWNLDLEGITPALSIRDVDDDEVVEVLLPCFQAADGSGSVLRRGVPVVRIGDHLVTRVFDLLLAQHGVARPDLPGGMAHRLRRSDGALHSCLAGGDHQRAGRGMYPDCPRIRQQL